MQECINIDSVLRVKLSFEGLPIPLPDPNSIGKAIVPADGKLLFLRALADWLEQWKSSQTRGLTNQTFDALIHRC